MRGGRKQCYHHTNYLVWFLFPELEGYTHKLCESQGWPIQHFELSTIPIQLSANFGLATKLQYNSCNF